MRVDYIRDGLLEEFHEGVVQFYEDKKYNKTPFYLRSCAKPLQASLIVDNRQDFTSEELAFCSGSHAGEECHVKIAKQILNKLNLDEACLKCGKHPPLSRTMQDKMLIRNEACTEIHNNCSGKHLGFLAICLAKGWDINTYYEPEHPLQVAVRKRIYELCEVPLNNNYPTTTDGCGVPIVSMPLNNLIIGYKNLLKYYPQIVSAIINNPYIYGGENRLDTEIIQNSTNLLAKVGAGGLCIVYNIELDTGFAVKVNDASTEARRIAVLEIINRMGWAKIPYDNTIKTLSGKVVGKIELNY